MRIRDLGVGAIVVQAPTLNRLQLKALLTVVLLARFLGAIVAFALAPLAAAFFAESLLISSVRALSLSLILGIYAVPPALVLRMLVWTLE